MTERERLAPAFSFGRGARLGLAVTAGWLLHDLVVFLLSGEAMLATVLLPGSLAALAVGLALGGLAGRFPLVLAAYALVGGLARFDHDRIHAPLTAVLGWFDLRPTKGAVFAYLGAAVLLASASLALTELLSRRAPRLPAGRTAVCLGFLAALGCGWLGSGELRPNWGLLLAASLALLVLGHARIPLRRTASVLVFAGAAAIVLRASLGPMRPSFYREDLPPPAMASESSPNAILIVLDTLRAQSLAPYGHRRVTTPRLDAWVEEHATVFEDSRSTSSFTLASHGSLFTGVLPSEHGAARLRPSAGALDPELPTLAERLRERGYQTGAIVSNTVYLNQSYGMDRGFEHFDRREGAYVGRYLALAQLSGRDLWAGRLTYRDARSITTAALNWLDRRRKDEPFFLMLNYLDAHTPYLTRAPHNEEFKDAVLAGVLASDSRELAYERNIHFLDAELGRLLDGLADRALIAGSLVVITSDHGEAFGEHGFQEHCWTLYEEVVRVPLYVKPPEGRRAARDGTRVNSADVAWMILDELGIPHGGPPAPASGLERPSSEWWRQVPMTEKYMAFAASVERNLDRDLIAWFEGDRKYVVSTLGEVEVFDVVLDPREEHPLELAEEERDRAFLRALEWWDANPLEAAQTETIPPDRLERLRALGYAGREN